MSDTEEDPVDNVEEEEEEKDEEEQEEATDLSNRYVGICRNGVVMMMMMS